MKHNYWLIFGALISTSVLAQQVTDTPASAPSATPVAENASPSSATNAPALKKKSKRKSEKKPAPQKLAPVYELKTVPLAPGPAMVAASNVNVRGQAKLKSEVLTRLTKGQTVTVMEEIVHNNSGPQEPSAWAKIVLPPAVHVWVHSSFIEATNKSVTPKKLKVRAGPGEEYSVVGMLNRGDAVKELGSKGDWMEIEAPADAYAFMASQYLRQEPAAPPIASTEPPPTVAPVTEPPAVTPAPTKPPPAPPASTEPVTPAPPTLPSAATEEPAPRRIVQREGIVRGTFSIQAPTKFELISPDNNKVINYLYTTSPNLDLRRYKGLRIVVTGEESLDERWRNTPVITIQRIQVVSE